MKDIGSADGNMMLIWKKNPKNVNLGVIDINLISLLYK